MKTMHLFAGLGGGLLADRILGHEPIIAVEWDKYCCQVLRERASEGWFPNLQVWQGDVRLFDPSEYAGKVDCIHAGFPCQDISVAGKQAGVGTETRSGLYREVLRIARVVRPQYLFLENVAAIVNNGLGTVLADITALGYDSEWLCLRASDCGAKHHRDRWWCLSNRNGNSESVGPIHAGQIQESDIARQSDVFPYAQHNRDGWRQQQPKSTKKTSNDVADPRHSGICERREPGDAVENVRLSSTIFRNDVSSREKQKGEILAVTDNKRCKEFIPSCISNSKDIAGWSVNENVPNSQRIGLSGQREPINALSAAKENDREATGTEYGCSSDFWSIEPDLGRVAHGIPNRIQRLKGLGNAQVPIQAAVAFQLLKTSFYLKGTDLNNEGTDLNNK
jgi:DNA (cytosine-5)-methyltransferase 1